MHLPEHGNSFSVNLFHLVYYPMYLTGLKIKWTFYNTTLLYLILSVETDICLILYVLSVTTLINVLLKFHLVYDNAEISVSLQVYLFVWMLFSFNNLSLFV